MSIESFKIILPFFCLFIYTCNAQMFGQEPSERERTYDVIHIRIEVSLNLHEKTVRGKTTTTLVPIKNNFSSFEVDAAGMNIETVYLDYSGFRGMHKNVNYKYDKQKLKILTGIDFNTSDTFSYTVVYNTKDPEKGMYFIQPDEFNALKPYQVWTQGEGEDNRYWFPCYDYPNDKAYTETIINVDGEYSTLSNGALTGVKINSDGTKTWHWKLNHPHSSYLVMLAVGKWDIIEDSWNGIPVYSYVQPGTKDIAFKSFDETPDMVKFYSEFTGFRYPWERYSQVVVEDFIYGGMENTAATVLVSTSVYDNHIPPDYDARGLVAHELAHQWWGDVVTCKNWNEIWLNEGFATYFDALYTEHLLGKDEFDYQMLRNCDASVWADSFVSRKPIYARDGLGVNTYNKGAVVLNMLRYQLGDETFREAMNIYISENQFKNVTTENLSDAVNSAVYNPMLDRSKNYHWFFEEWIYRAGQPSFNVSYTYDSLKKEVQLIVYQTQKLDSSSVFQIPVETEIITPYGKKTYFLKTSTEPQTFYLQTDRKPLCIIFNKRNKVLCKVKFSKSSEEWLWQLDNSEYAVDRINAVRNLSEFINDEKIISRLSEAMLNDKFWGVRNEIPGLLAKSDLKTAGDILINNYAIEKDSRIRRSYLNALADFYERNKQTLEVKKYTEFFLNVIQTESSEYAIAEAISSLGKISGKENIYDLVIPYIDRESHANVIRRTVLEALRRSDDIRTKDTFIKYSSKRYPDRLRTNAISSLEKYINEKSVIDYLNENLSDKNRWLRFTILSLLEKAGSKTSLPFLDKMNEKTNDNELRKRITEVISKIKQY